MSILRNRFLNTVSMLLAPDEPTGGAADDQNAGNDAGGEGGDDAGTDAGDDAGGDDAGTDAGGEAGADGDDDAGGADGDDEDEDPDLADLPPEAKAKAKAAIARRVAKEVGWRDRQIDKLHARRRSAEEDNRALETIADPARRAAAPVADDPNRKFTAEEVRTEAQRIAAQTDYDTKANDTDAQGRSVYGDQWKSTLARLPKLGGVEVTDMVDILATDSPHVVLYSLANPETYERVMSLPPARRRNEFVKLSLKPAPKPRKAEVQQQDSKRPGDVTPPVQPLRNGRRTAAQQVNLYDDKAADEAWYAARNATRRKKFTDVNA